MNRDVQSADLATENRGLSSTAASSLLSTKYWEILSESTELCFKSLKLGRVRGVVSLSDFPGSGSKDDSAFTKIVQELINRDILVTIFNCETVATGKTGVAGSDFFQNTGDGLAEFCDFIGIEPVLYVEETIDKPEIIDFYNRLAQRAAVITSDLPVAVIAPVRGLVQAESFATVFTMEEDPVKTVDLVDKYIHDKRMGVQWCDRCGGRFSPFS